MKGFKVFFEGKEECENTDNTLDKLPKSHAALVKGYKFKWENGNCLKGDNEHVGVIDPKKKTITIAAPYNYGREFTFLHELGHKVFEKWMTPALLKEWKAIIKKTKDKQNQNAEELWCMAYANYFAKNKMVIHNHPEWERHMKKFIKTTSR